MEQIRQFVSAALAGMIIAIGGIAFLTVESTLLGSMLFVIGLFAIVTFKLQLFTGKVGYIFTEKPIYLLEVGITLLGNFFGTMITAKLVLFTRHAEALLARLEPIIVAKGGDALSSIFILGIFCGILMFLAVDGYRTAENANMKIVALFMPIVVFILSGFEHVIANMFFFNLNGNITLEVVTFLLVNTLGNAVGAFIIPTYLQVFKIRK
ncbi:formate/nitrite transporter family protein [Chakrabartyella piscis]|uniref:formate/nitrite transporter family protein n=1 Tax=Chakrabartyella piscis TaxID=2918914 RepID=UPI002958475F|nr:formate/nitrite transporter family protein [Chakrabartyella piscis]